MPNTLPNRPVSPYRGGIKFGVIPPPSHPIFTPQTIVQPVGGPAFPPPPPVVDWIGPKIQWGVMANDVIGDCVPACMGHAIEAWTGVASNSIVIPDADVIAAYSALSGYNPNTGANDNGVVIGSAMNY